LPPLRILLVEDYPDNRTITLAYLQHTPYVVETAENGLIAVEKFVSGHFDLVLMDRQMPVMDGLTATRAIREWEQANNRPPTPIIALTAAALKGDREKCMAAGCTAYLTKPIKQQALLNAIRDHYTAALSSFAHDSLTDAIFGAKIADQRALYLKARRQDVAVISDALDRGDFEAVDFLGHGMRGSGGMFGFQPITDIGAGLEHAAGGADLAAARGHVMDLATYLDRVEVAPAA
jgi:CheY-like chemotaxis protein